MTLEPVAQRGVDASLPPLALSSERRDDIGVKADRRGHFPRRRSGRPRRTDVAASLAAHSGADRSGASSGSTQAGAVELLFQFMRLPGDHPATAVSRRPHHDDHPIVQVA